ncbi:MAG: anti-sigma factor family protein [Ardenticatenaceae bacterium]
MNECMNPVLVEDGDLMAYVDGEADPWVREHVESCPACLGQVSELGQVTQGVLGLMYRASCPEPERLGQYHLKLLSAGELLMMDAHLRKCVHCTDDLALLVGPEPDSLIIMVWKLFKDAVQVVEGALIPSPRRRMLGVRGRKREIQSYVADGVNVILDFQPVGKRRKEGRLVGTIQSARTASGSQAWLFEEGQKPISTEVDPLGTFIFEQITPGDYDLALEVEQKAILLRELNVG